jgi:hypothetical protein
LEKEHDETVRFLTAKFYEVKKVVIGASRRNVWHQKMGFSYCSGSI